MADMNSPKAKGSAKTMNMPMKAQDNKKGVDYTKPVGGQQTAPGTAKGAHGHVKKAINNTAPGSSTPK